MGAIPIYGESGRQIGWQTTKGDSGSSSGKINSSTGKTKYSYSTNPGSTDVTKNGISTVTHKPTTKKTTATTKDGKTYTFDGDNWYTYAKENGLDAGSLATAISYPSYVDSKEANRYLNEQADRYGVSLNSPRTAYEEAVSKDYASKNNVIPDYNTPLASAAAGQTQTNVNNTTVNGGTGISDVLSAYGITQPEYQTFDYSGYYDEAAQAYKDSVEAQRAAAIKALEDTMTTTNEGYDKAQQEAYLANYFANKQTARQLKESGIKGGMTESSLLKGNANFENAYNENEAARNAALREILLQQSQTNAQYDADINAYLAQLALSEAEAAQNELAGINSFNWNSYLSALDQLNNDRNYNLSLKQLEQNQAEEEYSRLMDEINLAYQLGDVERLKELGYYTDSVASEIAANIANNKAKTSNYGTTYSSSGTKGSSGSTASGETTTKDGEIPTFIMPNGTEVAYVNGKAYNVEKVEEWIKAGKLYEKNGSLYSYSTL